jgi:hypothetical protein
MTTRVARVAILVRKRKTTKNWNWSAALTVAALKSPGYAVVVVDTSALATQSLTGGSVRRVEKRDLEA